MFTEYVPIKLLFEYAYKSTITAVPACLTSAQMECALLFRRSAFDMHNHKIREGDRCIN